MKALYEKLNAVNDSSFLCRVLRGNFPFHWHFHPEYELTLIVRRRGRRFVGDSIGNYEDGDLVLIGPNLPHTWDSGPASPRQPHQAVTVQFLYEFLGDSFFKKPELKSTDRLLQRSSRGLQITGRTRDVVAERLLCMPVMRGLPRLRVLFEILETLSVSRDLRELASPGFNPSLQPARHARIDKICRHINQHLAEPVSVAQMSGQLHISQRTLSRFFKQVMGKTLQEYVNECRIGKACSNLINTNQTISQISYECGFNSLSHFNHKFRALKSVSPREYRRSYAH